MLDYKLVQALAMVVREGGFEKAAKVMHLTQSAVSQRVKSLEDQAGQVLLVRSSPPRATAAGQEMLKHFLRVARLEGDLAKAMAPGGGDSPGWDTLPIGLNADSLSTWFLDATKPFLRKNLLLLDLHTEDQEQTHKLLASGAVVGCVSSRQTSVQGCRVTRLGRMVYRLLATPQFVRTWFPEGITREACENAPAVIFNHDDEMHDKVLARAFESPPESVPAHFVPSSERFVDIVLAGLGYGMIPDYQGEPLLRNGSLVELSPALAIPVDLYWHCWDIGSPLLERFTAELTQNAWMVLGPEDMDTTTAPSDTVTTEDVQESPDFDQTDPGEDVPEISQGDDLFGPG